MAVITKKAASRVVSERTTTASKSVKTLQRAAEAAVAKQADPIGTATVSCSSLNVRSGAGTNFARIGGLTNGKTVEVYEEKDGWLRIKYGSSDGWISKAYTNYKGKDPGTTDPGTAGFQSFQAKVSGVDALWMRTGPGTDYDTVKALDKGTVVTVIGESNGWYQVQYGNLTGWMSGKYLEKVTGSDPGTTDPGTTKPENPTGTFEVVVSVSNYLNVRTGPGTSYDAIGQLHNGDKITVLEEKNGWYRFNYNGKEGWISGDYTYKPGEVSAAGQTAADKARSLMSQYVSEGWTYSQDYRSSTGHYDCSSFTHRCWSAAGVNLQWACAAEQARMCANNGGEIKSKSDIQPGDLLFWSYKDNGRYRNISHVAIAIGGGKRIDAGGTPVREDSVGSPLMIGRPSVLLK